MHIRGAVSTSQSLFKPCIVVSYDGLSAQILLHEPYAKLDDANCVSSRKTLAASRIIVDLMHAVTATNYDVTLLDLQPFVSQIFTALYCHSLNPTDVLVHGGESTRTVSQGSSGR